VTWQARCWVVVSEHEREGGSIGVLTSPGDVASERGEAGMMGRMVVVVVVEKRVVMCHGWTRFQIWAGPDRGAARVGYNYIKICFRYCLCGSVG